MSPLYNLAVKSWVAVAMGEMICASEVLLPNLSWTTSVRRETGALKTVNYSGKSTSIRWACLQLSEQPPSLFEPVVLCVWLCMSVHVCILSFPKNKHAIDVLCKLCKAY